jgi:hypothetical protein
MIQLFHRKRSKQQVLAGIRPTAQQPWKLTFEFKPLPGAGAEQYAFETLELPPYPVMGNSAGSVKKPLRETSPASYQLQTAVLIGNPPSGTFQGQFVTQPLMDPNTAIALGITVPGSIPPGAYNTLPATGPVTAP